MGAAMLLQRLRAAGFTLRAAGANLLVTPASMLTQELREALRSFKSDLYSLLRAETIPPLPPLPPPAAGLQFASGARQCVDCENFGLRGTCLEPVAAGLLTATEGFGIAWPPEGCADTCGAFVAKAHQGHRTAPECTDRSTTR